ncbi:MAG: hypothetical protein IJW17_06895 [Lentisphaeria bacterium]|nr:hypothetical protein [Lentisphaeria bacterium]
MKKMFFSGAAGAFALLAAAGCSVLTPKPLADANGEALPEPVSYYGDIELFEEKNVPLAVTVISSAASEDVSPAETMKSALTKFDVNCVPYGKPSDLKINVDSVYQEITPAPKCRLSHLLSISVSAADGTKLLPTWEHKTEVQQAYANNEEAKAKLRPQINESVNVWVKNYFNKSTENVLKVSIVRFRLSRGVGELDPLRFEGDLRKVLNRLREINGVADVRMIEADKKNRIASFRVLYRKDVFLKKQIQKQK